MITVSHQALSLGWPKPSDIDKPKTLVIGSFNPYNDNDHDSLDYYYGRTTNQFWKSIARINGKNESYYFDQRHRLDRKMEIMQGRFCCLDVIDSIDFECENELILSKFLNNKVFRNFADSIIWTTKTKVDNEQVALKRNYNNSIQELLNTTDSITKVIHTMGNIIENINRIRPIERNATPRGFRQFVRDIINTCNDRGIDFNFYSMSPSQYAVNTNATRIESLDEWLQQNLNL